MISLSFGVISSIGIFSSSTTSAFVFTVAPERSSTFGLLELTVFPERSTTGSSVLTGTTTGSTADTGSTTGSTTGSSVLFDLTFVELFFLLFLLFFFVLFFLLVVVLFFLLLSSSTCESPQIFENASSIVFWIPCLTTVLSPALHAAIIGGAIIAALKGIASVDFCESNIPSDFSIAMRTKEGIKWLSLSFELTLSLID